MTEQQTPMVTGVLSDLLNSVVPPQHLEPPDGSLILVDDSTVYVRNDLDEPRAYENFLHFDGAITQGERLGDWYKLDGSDTGEGPLYLSEVLGYDEPPEDRSVHQFEVLVPAFTLFEKAAEFTAAQAEGGEQR